LQRRAAIDYISPAFVTDKTYRPAPVAARAGFSLGGSLVAGSQVSVDPRENILELVKTAAPVASCYDGPFTRCA